MDEELARFQADMSLSAIPVAFLAGLVSFLAPCVLPLVPGYLSAVSAVDAERLGERGTARRVVVSSVPFVLGFTAFFVLPGVGAALVGGRPVPNLLLLERSRVSSLSSSGSRSWSCSPAGAVAGRGARPGRAQPWVGFLLGGAFASAPLRASGRCSLAPRPRGLDRVGSEGRSCSRRVLAGLAVRFVLAGAGSGARWERSLVAGSYRAIEFAGGAVLFALGLLLFFERFYVLRVCPAASSSGLVSSPRSEER